MALLFAIIKYGFYLYEPMPTSITPAIFTNIFLLMAAIFVGLYLAKRAQTEETAVLMDIKTGLQAGLPYTILVAGFLYLFYSQINPEYNEHQIAEAITSLDKNLNDPIEFKKIKAANPDFEVKSKNEIREQLIQGPKTMYTAGVTSTLSMLGMLLLSTLYSILCAYLFRTIYKPR